MNIFVSQRVIKSSKINESRDCLDQRITKILNYCNINPIFIPNNLIQKEDNMKLIKFLKSFNSKGLLLTGGDNFGDFKDRDKTEFATIVQDDMLILEKNWDRLLMDVAKEKRAFSVSGRGGHEISQDNQCLYFFDHVGREYPLGSSFLAKVFRKILNFMPVDSRIRCSVWVARFIGARRRTIVNRGPLLFDMQKYNELGGLDEKFAPFEFDDVDICLRAIKEQKGYNYILPILYKEVNGSKQNNLNSAKVSLDSIVKNRLILLQNHSEFIKYEKKRLKYRI